MSTTITFPTAEEEELIRRFTVNKNYLQALRGFLRHTYGRGDDLYPGLRQAVMAHPPYQRISGGTTDVEEVRRWLVLAWASEMQLHLPASIGQAPVIGTANAWAPVHATFWARYGTWLRTTREARLKAREEQWKAEHRKRKVSREARTRISTSVAPTTLFDCFWRLRIKSNYGTIDPYLVAQIGQSDHAIFNTALRAVVVATAGLLELCIARRVGTAEFARIADDFIGQDASGLSGRLATRLQGLGLRP